MKHLAADESGRTIPLVVVKRRCWSSSRGSSPSAASGTSWVPAPRPPPCSSRICVQTDAWRAGGWRGREAGVPFHGGGSSRCDEGGRKGVPGGEGCGAGAGPAGCCPWSRVQWEPGGRGVQRKAVAAACPRPRPCPRPRQRPCRAHRRPRDQAEAARRPKPVSACMFDPTPVVGAGGEDPVLKVLHSHAA